MLTFIIIVLLAGVVFSFFHDWHITDRFPAEGDFLKIDGEALHYKRLGRKSDKLPIIFIHGASCNLRDMELAFADALQEERELIFVDRPGHGHSGRSPHDSELAEQARKIGLLLDHLKIERVIICGQSYGGGVALALALARPDLNGGMFLLAPVAYPWPGGISPLHHICSTPVIGPVLTRAIVTPFAVWRGRKITNDTFRPDTQPPGYYEAVGLPLLFRAREFRANSADLVALHGEITRQCRHYDQIKAPVMIMAGSHDVIVLSTIHSRGLQQELPQARFEMLDNIGHVLHHSANGDILRGLQALDEAIVK